MFLRQKIRRKDGKEHRAWSVVENRRVEGGRVVQRQVLYPGEISDSQRAAWSRAVDAFDEGGQSTQIALFPEDRVAPALDCGGVDPAERDAGAAPTSMGRVLVGHGPLGSASVGRFLYQGACSLARGHELVEHSEDAGELSTDLAGQRMAAASAMVR